MTNSPRKRVYALVAIASLMLAEVLVVGLLALVLAAGLTALTVVFGGPLLQAVVM